MDDQRLGSTLRALRRRRSWRQSDLAARAKCSQNAISLLERGHLESVSLRLVRRVLAALDATLVLDVRWRGAALDRLIDEAHAALMAAVAGTLRQRGWIVEIEVTYSEYGERGSIDVLAFWPPLGVLLVVEVKTVIASAEATLRKLDEKVRLGPAIAAKRFGWRARSVSRLVVLADTPTNRRRVSRHANLFFRVLAHRNVAVKRWLAQPAQPLAGLWFLSIRDGPSAIAASTQRERIRSHNSESGNSVVA